MKEITRATSRYLLTQNIRRANLNRYYLHTSFVSIGIILGIISLVTTADTQEAGGETPPTNWWRANGPVCTSSATGRLTSAPRLLRQISLDLLGRVPNEDELDLSESIGSIPADPNLSALLDEWMAKPAFNETMKRYHEKLILPQDQVYVSNNSIVRLENKKKTRTLTDGTKQIQNYGGKQAVYLRSGTAANVRRLGNLACLPGEKNNHQMLMDGLPGTQYAVKGSYVAGELDQANLGPRQPGWRSIKIKTCTGSGETCFQEGWVYVNPYWLDKIDLPKPVPRYSVEIFDPVVDLENYTGPRSPTEANLKNLASYDFQDATFINDNFARLETEPNAVKVCARTAYLCGDRLKDCMLDYDREYTRQSGINEVLELINWAIRSSGPPDGIDTSGIDDSSEIDENLGYFRFLTTSYTLLDYWINRMYRRFWVHSAFQYGEDVDEARGVTGDSWGKDPLVDDSWKRDAGSGWRGVRRPSVHSGILTTPFFTKRFATNRARVNQFYTAFLCDPFDSKSNEPDTACVRLRDEDEGVKDGEGIGEERNNLTKRCVCKNCHQKLERAAVHWGRWRVNNGWGYMGKNYPGEEDYEGGCKTLCPAPSASETPQEKKIRDDKRSYCTHHCKPYFITSAEFLVDENTDPHDRAYYERHLGARKATYWFEEDEDNNPNTPNTVPAEIQTALDEGPRALVMKNLVIEADGTNNLAECSTRRMSEHLLGRKLETSGTDQKWLKERTREFIASGYNFKEMIKSIILDPLYQQNR